MRLHSDNVGRRPAPFGRPIARLRTAAVCAVWLILAAGTASAVDRPIFCGHCPTVAGSGGMLFLSAQSILAGTKYFRWTSSDRVLGDIDTGPAVAGTWNYNGGVDPPRLIFIGSGRGYTVYCDVLFGSYNRGVVDVVGPGVNGG